MEEILITGRDKPIPAKLKSIIPQWPLAEIGKSYDVHILRFRDKSGYQIDSHRNYTCFHKFFKTVEELNTLFDFNLK